jgi:hypothetical protein
MIWNFFGKKEKIKKPRVERFVYLYCDYKFFRVKKRKLSRISASRFHREHLSHDTLLLIENGNNWKIENRYKYLIRMTTIKNRAMALNYAW